MIQTLPQELLELIHGGENIIVEFKKSRTEITKDVYETVCAFSNRDGGHIFLGVKDNGEILGIENDKVDKIKKEFVTSINSENKMYPPLYLTPIEYKANGKHILYIRVPVSQDVCRCNGRIYDRNHESDIDITHHSDEVYRLYSRKKASLLRQSCCSDRITPSCPSFRSTRLMPFSECSTLIVMMTGM